MLEKLCGPAILYIGFSLTQIILDIFQEMYNTAFLKFMVMITTHMTELAFENTCM